MKANISKKSKIQIIIMKVKTNMKLKLIIITKILVKTKINMK